MEPVKYLSREEAAKYVTDMGLHLTKNTLQKWVTVGGGPVYRRFGHRAVYLKEDLDAWIEKKMSQPARTYNTKKRAPDDFDDYGDA